MNIIETPEATTQQSQLAGSTIVRISSKKRPNTTIGVNKKLAKTSAQNATYRLLNDSKSNYVASGPMINSRGFNIQIRGSMGNTDHTEITAYKGESATTETENDYVRYRMQPRVDDYLNESMGRTTGFS